MHARIVQVMLTAVGFIASLSLSTGVHAAVANGLIAYPCETGNPPETHQQNICLIDPAAPNPAATRKQITFDGINALPAWSPDGTMLAYTHLEGNSAEIFVMKISDLSAKPLVPGAAPAWSPDGNRIAFTAPSAIVGGAQEIWAIDLNGANLQQLTKRPAGDVGPGGNSLVTWAPDSQSIAYGYTVQDPNHPVVDKHTTIEVTNLVTNQTIPDLTGPYLCPGVGVCRQNLDAKGNVIPGQFVLDANSPAWSPTGNEIAYAAGLEGSGVQIWKIDANGNKRQLTFPDVPPSTPVPPFLPPLFDANPYPTNDDPAWSPDGTKILYTSFPTYLPIPDAPLYGR